MAWENITDAPPATLICQAGADPFALMTRSGHSSMKTTMGYVHLAGVLYWDEAEALEERLYGKTAAK